MSTLKVAFFRHTVFLPSEPFIPLQMRTVSDDTVLIARDPVQRPVDDIPVITLSDQGRTARAAHMLGRSRPLRSALRVADADVLHAQFGVEGLYSIAAARREGIAHFTTFHGYDAALDRNALLRARKVAWVRYAAQRRALLRSESHLLAVSEYVARNLVRHGARPDRVRVHFLGTDVDAVTQSPVPEAPTIVHVARLAEVKGGVYLLRAMRHVLRAVPDATLRLVGSGPLEHDLRTLADELGISSSVTFEGALPHDEAIDSIRSARVAVLPSITSGAGQAEAASQVLQEAAALGRPVVATRSGGIPEVVVDGVTGLLVPERDVGALAERITHLLQSPVDAQKLGSAGRRYAEQHFNARVQGALLAGLYRRALDGRAL
ncbi:glycosyltransferase [Xylanimonas allomyrinae]|uniref:Glycosyltransferase n=1 Tax=Xylanimonas allomyrinae TaxID=2509459 RepID=A0A4P6EPP6_9MICO|nr:glycosyltransferase [Xylanimonas allomyrinae]QAY63349.1 glycosyltransferase [Xylanimonas allomyrinae]